MTPKDKAQIARLMSAIEDTLDTNIDDARQRKSHFNALRERIGQVETRILDIDNRLAARFDRMEHLLTGKAEKPDALTAPAKLKTYAKIAIQWLLPIAIGAYEAIKALP